MKKILIFSVLCFLNLANATVNLREISDPDNETLNSAISLVRDVFNFVYASRYSDQETMDD